MNTTKVYVIKHETATFLVDAQKGFTPLCPNELPVPDGQNIVAECIKTFEKTGSKIASKDAHPIDGDWVPTFSDGSNIATLNPKHGKQNDLFWPNHCCVGEEGFELIPGLPEMSEFDYIIYKGAEKDIHVYSACYQLLKPNSKGDKISTGVIEFLRAKLIDTVIITGLATNYCCMATAMDLKVAGFDVIMNLGACRGIGDVASSIETMKAAGIKMVDSADDLVVVR